MILSLLVLLIIILLTLYLATQGALSAALELVAAAFASIAAMALFEPLQGIIAGWRPEYARGVTFLVLYFLIFSGLRLATDQLVPKNVVMPAWIDRSLGAVVGFFAAMIVMGTTVIGVEMLPLGTTLLDFDRFPTANRMRPEADAAPGAFASQNGLWLNPDRFVLGLWGLTSGRALGGSQSFSRIHPDLSVESYGYRNVVQQGAGQALQDRIVNVSGTALVNKADPLWKRVSGGSSENVLLVRTTIDRGNIRVATSADGDGLFRITPTQVRLVTSAGRQYYPAGYLDRGTELVKTPWDTGYVVDNYSDTGKVVYDWVFAIGENEDPTCIEIKQLARFPLPALASLEKAPELPVLEASAYPPRRESPAELTVTVYRAGLNDRKTPMAKADVWVLSPMVKKRDVRAVVDHAYDLVLEHKKAWEKNEGGWGDQLAGKPGVPGFGHLNAAQNHGLLIKNWGPEELIHWENLLELLLVSEMTTNGSQNLSSVSKYFNDTVVPLFDATKSVNYQGTTSADGKFSVKLRRDSFVVVVRDLESDAFFIWANPITISPKEGDGNTVSMDCSSAQATFKIDLKP